ncbi:hypothetical protein [Chryseobacterium cucumeris]
MKSLIIYFNKEKSSFQVVKPTEEFNGDWAGLAHGVTNGVYHKFKVI